MLLRSITPADLPAAQQLLVDRGDAGDGEDLGLVVASEGFEGTAVVVDGDRVVSTLTLLDEVVHVDGLAVPAGQIELVATDAAYEGRGLIRELVDWAHRRSRSRGHLLQVLVGIPFFYRQFGYAYAVPMPTWRPLTASPPPPRDVTVRRAGAGDVPAMRALQDRVQSGVDVRMGHSDACWRWLVERTGTEQLVAERNGRVVGVARAVPPEEGAMLGELAADDGDAAVALATHVRRWAGGGRPVVVQDRWGVPDALRAHLSPPVARADWYYARVESLGPLLVHLAPVLQARLAAAGLSGRHHEVLLSSWRSHVRFSVGPSGVRLVAEGGAEQAPLTKGGSGVPPDALAPLVLGPYGALGLEERLPDCRLGRQRQLMAALFPPRSADLLTFFLPT